MKVVDVSEFYAERGGGVRTYTHAKLAAGAREGVEIVVVAPGDDDREEAREGGRIVWVKSPPLPLDPRYRLLLRERAVHAILDDEAPDVVEGSSTWTGGLFVARWRGDARKALVFHQDPVAVYSHTLFDRVVDPKRLDRLAWPWWFALRRLCAAYDVTVVAGDWLAQRLRAHGVRDVTAVPFGIPERHALTRPDPSVRRALLRRAGAHDDAALLIAIARHHPEKRLGTVIRGASKANAKLRAEGRPGVGLVIFGDGPLRAWVDREARRHGPAHVAGFTADREHLRAALASADAFVHGSAAETYGLVVAEALDAGLPLVVPARGGAADLAEPAWAETYPAGDSSACASAIVRLLDRDPASLQRAARCASSERVLDLNEHFERLFARYAELADRRPRALAGEASEASS